MIYNRPKTPTFAEAKKSLDAINVSIRRTIGSELRVNLIMGLESAAYYTEDIMDALRTGRAMDAFRSS